MNFFKLASDLKDPSEAKEKIMDSVQLAQEEIKQLQDNISALFSSIEREVSGEASSLVPYRLSDVLYESTDVLGDQEEPEILTCTENAGLVLQRERFSKRVATEDTSDYKIVLRNDIVYNPYLLWAGAIDQCTVVDKGITSPAYIVLHVKDGFAPALVGHILKSDYMKKHYWNISIGTHERRRTAPIDKFLDLEIQLPDKDAQKHIMELLEQIMKQSERITVIQKALLAASASMNEFYTRR